MKKLINFIPLVALFGAFTLFAGGTSDNEFIIGDSSTNEKKICLNRDCDNIIRVPNGGGDIEFSNNSGVSFSKIGSGSGLVVNYVSANNAESVIGDWAAYADAAGTDPVDADGGSPNITFAISGTSPLRDVNSFLLTKGGSADRQGEGVRYPITLVSADDTNSILVTFEYEVSSGTYADGDMGVFLVETSGPTAIKVGDIDNVTGSGKFVGSVEVDSNTSYRLAFHIQTTSASDYSLKFDTIFAGPNANLAVTSPGSFDGVKLYTAFIQHSAGTPSISHQTGDWIDSLTDDGTGLTTVNLRSGAFIQKYSCFCTTAGGAVGVCNPTAAGDLGLSSVQVQTYTSASLTAGDARFHIFCSGI